MPATARWSRRKALRLVRRRARRRRSSAVGRPSASGSGPSVRSSAGRPLAGSSGATKSSPKVRGSTKRSSLASSRPSTTWVCATRGAPGGTRSSWPLMRRWHTSASAGPRPGARSTRRNLPRRRAATRRRPTSAARNAGASWRRTERAPSTSTATTRRPSTARSRPRRTVSTSGSSGTLAGREHGEALVRGGALGRLLRAALAVADDAPAHGDARAEALRVVRALVLDAVARGLEAEARRELLEAVLRVAERRGVAGGRREALAEQVEHEGACRRETAGEVGRADERLEGVGEDRCLRAPAGGLLAPPEQDGVADPELGGGLGERPGAHDRGAHAREVALGQVRVGAVELLGRDEAEHGVAEELETLVRLLPGRLGAVGAVGERPVEQVRVVEVAGEAPGERLGPAGTPRPRLRRRRGHRPAEPQAAPSFALT